MVERWRTRFGWRKAALLGALSAAALAISPPAQAGLLDFLFGGFQERPVPPGDVSGYAEPGVPQPSSPLGSENVRSSGGTGHAVMFCVRLCDGQHFPLEHVANATPIETCRAMCPASRTKVFFGGEIDHAVARDGARYADLDTAFVYRTKLVPNCTCNGRDAFGLAHFDLSSDPTLRPGDLVATKTGYVAYSGKRGESDAFTPVDRGAVEAELSHRATPVRLGRQGKEKVAAEEPDAPLPRDVDQATR